MQEDAGLESQQKSPRLFQNSDSNYSVICTPLRYL